MLRGLLIYRGRGGFTWYISPQKNHWPQSSREEAQGVCRHKRATGLYRSQARSKEAATRQSPAQRHSQARASAPRRSPWPARSPPARSDLMCVCARAPARAPGAARRHGGTAGGERERRAGRSAARARRWRCGPGPAQAPALHPPADSHVSRCWARRARVTRAAAARAADVGGFGGAAPARTCACTCA